MSIQKIISCDIGQAADYTAIIVLEAEHSEPVRHRTETVYPEYDPDDWTGERSRPYSYKVAVYRLADGTETEERPGCIYRVRSIERLPLGTPYQEIARTLRNLDKDYRSTVVIDATGVGRPVVEMARRAGVSCYSLTITGGESVTEDHQDIRVPKRDLVTTAQLILQNRRLKAPKELPLAETLIKELRSFRMKINLQTGHESFEAWRERDHDDIVLALCMGLWIAERHPPIDWNAVTVGRTDMGSPRDWCF